MRARCEHHFSVAYPVFAGLRFGMFRVFPEREEVLVLLSAVAWLFWSESSGMGAFLLTWSVIVGTLDNVVRPILIRKGANLPLLLVFAGVLGGLISFGLIGLFVGPVVLAVLIRCCGPGWRRRPVIGQQAAGDRFVVLMAVFDVCRARGPARTGGCQEGHDVRDFFRRIHSSQGIARNPKSIIRSVLCTNLLSGGVPICRRELYTRPRLRLHPLHLDSN